MDLVDPCVDRWRSLFDEHFDQLSAALPAARIEHIGSTAIGTIAAKNVVDIIVGVDEHALSNAVQAIQAIGYHLDGRRGQHAWLCWPAVELRQLIAHVVPAGGAEWQRRIRFRDILRADPGLARDYEQLKLRAAARTDDWTEYTGMKKAFVHRVLVMPTPDADVIES